MTDEIQKSTPNDHGLSLSKLSQKILEQGDIIEKIKEREKINIDEAMNILKQLKSDYKRFAGTEWKPCSLNDKTEHNKDQTSDQELKSKNNLLNTSKITTLSNEIINVGNTLRKLKAEKAERNTILSTIAELLNLKSQYKELTGHQWQSVIRSRTIPIKSVHKTPPPKQKNLGVEVKKEEKFAEWYTQVITKSEMIEYYDVSGCYILRPRSYAIWEEIRKYLDKKIQQLGVQNCYFPMFVPRTAIEREKDHIEDFAPEVAWVTKSGTYDLAEPIAIRPTSEAVMYPAYAKWIKSYRDLPFKLNQWNNVVRWEFENPQPFIRSREFLWQEGHTAFATAEEAQEEVYKVLDLYASMYTDLLAVPVVKGRKTENEKFAGGNFSVTVEILIPTSGRGVQGATSHFLGQNFSKMFEIVYFDSKTQDKKYVYQNSWGITTRAIGIMIMIHSDNRGLVLPPRVAAHQVVIVPCGITASITDQIKGSLIEACKKVQSVLGSANIRVHGDYRDKVTPGWKFSNWELKGAPIRLEMGPKELANKKVVLVRRDTGSKAIVDSNAVVNQVQVLLQNIHESLLKNATDRLKSQTITTTNWSDFVSSLDKKNILLSPFCGDTTCEEKIKQDSAKTVSKSTELNAQNINPSVMGAKSLCIPFDQPKLLNHDDKCIRPSCKNKPAAYTLFGRSY